jgi:hypothetical protein
VSFAGSIASLSCSKREIGATGIEDFLLCHRAVERSLEIGVVEDDERRVAAELHRARDDVLGRFGEEEAANAGRAGERQFPHPWIRQHGGGGRTRTGNRKDVDDARGTPASSNSAASA